MVLVLLPITYEIVSITGLAFLLDKNEQQLHKLDSERATLFKLEQIGSTGANAILQIGSLPVSTDARLTERRLENIKRQLTDNFSESRLASNQSEVVLQAEILKNEILRLIDRAELFYRKPDRKESDKFNFLRNQAFATGIAFENFSKSIVDMERSTKENEPAQIAAMRSELLLALTAISITCCSLTLALVYFFSADTAKRLKAIQTNIQSLASGQVLHPPLAGRDEIADLDSLLHTVSMVLAISRKQQSIILDNAVELLCTVDEKLKFTIINHAAERLWHYQADDLLGRSVLTIVPPALVPNTSAAFKAARRHQALAEIEQPKTFSRPEIIETTILCGNGRSGIFRWSVSWSSSRKSYTCVVRDISASKSAERLKSRFIAMVSHDLRMPLCSLGVSLETIEAGKRGEIPKGIASKLLTVEEKLAQLNKVVDGLLELEKMGAGRGDLRKETLHTYNVISLVKENLHPLALQKKVTIVGPDDDCFIEADQSRLTGAIASILEFSINRAPSGTSVKIETTVNDGLVKLHFNDSGQPIAATERNLLFERYATSSAMGGMQAGLALPVAQAIIKAHGGHIEIIGNSNESTSLCIALPTIDSSKDSVHTEEMLDETELWEESEVAHESP